MRAGLIAPDSTCPKCGHLGRNHAIVGDVNDASALCPSNRPTIRLWRCDHCGDLVPRTQELPDGEAPNHRSTWVPYVAHPEDPDD